MSDNSKRDEETQKLEKIKSILIDTAKWMYEQTWILALTWTLMMLIVTLFVDFRSCIQKAPWITESLFLYSLFFFSFYILVILFFMMYQIKLIRKNEKEGHPPGHGTAIVEKAEYKGMTPFGGENLGLFIIPLYAISLYAISKIIIIIFKEEEKIINKFDSLSVWIGIGSLALYGWFLLKKYTKKNKSKYSIKYTIIVVVITLFSLYGKQTIPYIFDVVKVSKCVLLQGSHK